MEINNNKKELKVSLVRGDMNVSRYYEDNLYDTKKYINKLEQSNEELKVNPQTGYMKIMSKIEKKAANELEQSSEKSEDNQKTELIKVMSKIEKRTVNELEQSNEKLEDNQKTELIKVMSKIEKRDINELGQSNEELKVNPQTELIKVMSKIEKRHGLERDTTVSLISNNPSSVNKVDFIIIDGCINLIDRINSNENYFAICNFNIIAEKIIIKDNGLFVEEFCVFKCILSNTNEERTIYMKYDELNSDKWIISKLGVKYCLFPINNAYKYLKVYVAEQFKNILSEIQYTHVGWRKIGDRFIYLHGGGVVGDYNFNIKGDRGKVINVNYNISRESALKETIDMINISDNKFKTLPLLLYSHLAVIREVYMQAGYQPKFIMWIYGLTGSMKTSVSKIFFNLFNRERDYISATFKDTKTAVEIKTAEYKDSILLLDDYHPTTSSIEKREMQSLASHILRIYGDGISKSRSNKNLGKAKEYPPRGLCVITGEDIIDGESSVARFIGIEVCPGDYKTDILSYYQNNTLIYSTHMYYFIEWVSKNFNEIVSFIREKFLMYRNSILNIFRHKRLADSYTFLYLTYEILFAYCNSVKNANINNLFYNCEDVKNIIIDTIKSHEQYTVKQNPAILYLLAIQELIQSKRCKVIEKNKPNNEKCIIGYKDDEFYYLIPNLSYSNVIDFWKRQNIEFPVTSDRVNKALDELNVIKTKVEGNSIKRTVKASINGERKRYLIIYRDVMDKILNNI